jgi:hypothetical protein
LVSCQSWSCFVLQTCGREDESNVGLPKTDTKALMNNHDKIGSQTPNIRITEPWILFRWFAM